MSISDQMSTLYYFLAHVSFIDPTLMFRTLTRVGGDPLRVPAFWFNEFRRLGGDSFIFAALSTSTSSTPPSAQSKHPSPYRVIHLITSSLGSATSSAIMALDSFFHNKIESMKLEIIQGQAVLRRLEAQRNDYNSRVRLLREELGLLQQPGSYVGEVVKVMGTKKVLVKVHPEGKYGMILPYMPSLPSRLVADGLGSSC